MRTLRPKVAVLLYPGCIFLEIAPALELLAPRCDVLFYTPDGANLCLASAHAAGQADAAHRIRSWRSLP